MEPLALPALLTLGLVSQAASWELCSALPCKLLWASSSPRPWQAGPWNWKEVSSKSLGMGCTASWVVVMRGFEHLTHLTLLSPGLLSHDHREHCIIYFHCLVFSVGLAPRLGSQEHMGAASNLYPKLSNSSRLEDGYSIFKAN